MTAVQIVPASEEHLREISVLAGLIWRQYYPAIISREQIEYMLTKMYSLETLQGELRERIRYKRLLAGDKLTGFAAFGETEDPAVFKLHKLYLYPLLHRRGLGSLLLNHCEQDARKSGAQQLILNVNKRNSRAIAFYQKNGFTIADSVTVEIGDGFVMDDYVMAKSLT